GSQEPQHQNGESSHDDERQGSAACQPDRARRGGLRRRCPPGSGGPRRAGAARHRLQRDFERPRRDRPDLPGPLTTQRDGAGAPAPSLYLASSTERILTTEAIMRPIDSSYDRMAMQETMAAQRVLDAMRDGSTLPYDHPLIEALGDMGWDEIRPQIEEVPGEGWRLRREIRPIRLPEEFYEPRRT